MIDGIEKHYQAIADSIDESINEAWESAQLNAIFFADSITLEAEFRRPSGKVVSFAMPMNALRAFQAIRAMFADAGKPVWGQAYFTISSNGQFNMDFGYKDCDERGNTHFDPKAWQAHQEERQKRLTTDTTSEAVPEKVVRPKKRWWRTLLVVSLTVLGAWLAYRTTIYVTVAQLNGGRVIYDDETTKWRIRLSAAQLIDDHQYTVDASRGLSDRELIGAGDLKKFNNRIAAWNALSLAATIASDARIDEYIRRHLESSNRWTSEDPPH